MVLACIASGIMVFVYAMAWLMIPMEGQSSNIYSRAIKDKHGVRLVLAILIPLLILMQVITSTLHVPYIGFISWPTLLAAGLCPRSGATPTSRRRFIDHEVVPLLGNDFHGHGRRLLVFRIIAGLVLGGIGIALLVEGHTTVAALRPVGGAALVVAAAIVVFGPWWLSLVRDLIAERQARVRAEERAQMAAHVHDSVLQTLALIQRSSDDPQNVVRLARAQERELRAWLFEGRPPGVISEDGTMLGVGVALLQRQVEADHGIAVQVVVVGDCELDEPLRALLDAARSHGQRGQVVGRRSGLGLRRGRVGHRPDLRAGPGPGLRPGGGARDRRGIAQSIESRVARFGGEAVIRSAPGEGTEVQLFMPRRERVK